MNLLDALKEVMAEPDRELRAAGTTSTAQSFADLPPVMAPREDDPGLKPRQPRPTPNDKPAVWDLVMKDFCERDELGLRKYGTRLQPYNGRDTMRDAYEELLDAAVYMRQLIFERDGR